MERKSSGETSTSSSFTMTATSVTLREEEETKAVKTFKMRQGRHASFSAKKSGTVHVLDLEAAVAARDELLGALRRQIDSLPERGIDAELRRKLSAPDRDLVEALRRGEIRLVRVEWLLR